MNKLPTRTRLYGTEEQISAPLRLEAGRLVVEITDGAVSSISSDGVETICGIAYPVRDVDWGTATVHDRSESVEPIKDGVRYFTTFVSGDFTGSFVCEVMQAGEVELRVSFIAKAATRVCRAGFVVLHPLDVAGAPLRVLHPDASEQETIFPRLISPSQPAMSIVGLDWHSQGIVVRMRFEGDIFEMEDQRNWSDASYKTFCRPLFLPYPFDVEMGATIEQAITLRFEGRRAIPSSARDDEFRLGGADGSIVPEVGLALDPAWPTNGALGTADILLPRVPRWLVRVNLASDDDFVWLEKNAHFLRGSPFDLEAVVDGESSVLEQQLRSAATKLAGLGLDPEHLVSLPRAYLRCIQTWEPPPDGATPDEALESARRWFPKQCVGGGMLTNFTELNRCPPSGNFDYITHSLTPLVHAADDRSVMRALDTLVPIFDTLEVHAMQRPWRLGLASIGMRTNPYGRNVVDNPTGIRLAMAQCDPRQKGLFGAAWMVGVAAATIGRPIEFLALAAPYGPFGLASTPTGNCEDEVYPAYHAFRALAELSGQRRLTVHLPAGLRGVAAQGVDGPQAVVANCTASPVRLDLAPNAATLVLDAASMPAAAADRQWLEHAPRHHGAITLDAFGIAQISWATRKPE